MSVESLVLERYGLTPLFSLMLQTLTRFLKQLRTYALAHKVVSGIVIIAVLGGGYWTYSKLHSTAGETRYVLGTVATGTIISAVSASGQVSASDSIDLKPQVSGTITWVGVKPGDKVEAGQALVSIDNTTALQALNDAKKSLAADQLQYQKDTAQAPINYQTHVNALATAKDNLATDYNNTYTDITSTYLDLPSIVSGAENAYYGYDFDSRRLQSNADSLLGLFTTQDTTAIKTFQKKGASDYDLARSTYTSALVTYQGTSRASDQSTVEKLLADTISTVTDAAQTLQTELNFFNAVADIAQTSNITLPSKFPTVQNATRTYLSTANADLSTLLADKKNLDSAKQAITDAQNAVALDLVGNDPDGSNPISLQISKNSIEKAQQDIENQKTNLGKYTIRAPFAGTIATVSAKTGDSAGSTVATIISRSQIATLSVNEVDAAKIALNDKATLTFDAVDGLTLTGAIAEIDAVGTVSQGVVSYDVKIAFDTTDARVKPGMTVNAEIQTDIRQNVLTVPSSAVKTQGTQHYVQVFNPPLTDSGASGTVSATPPQNVNVDIGISDNSSTEIVSGLSSGQQVVTRTVSGNTTTTTTSTGASRNGGFGGGGIRL